MQLNSPPTPGFGDDAGGAGGGAHPLQSLMERMTGGGPGGLDANDLSNVLRGKNSLGFPSQPNLALCLGMNPSELASLISSVGSGGGAPGLMPGNRRSPRCLSLTEYTIGFPCRRILTTNT